MNSITIRNVDYPCRQLRVKEVLRLSSIALEIAAKADEGVIDTERAQNGRILEVLRIAAPGIVPIYPRLDELEKVSAMRQVLNYIKQEVDRLTAREEIQNGA